MQTPSIEVDQPKRTVCSTEDHHCLGSLHDIDYQEANLAGNIKHTVFKLQFKKKKKRFHLVHVAFNFIWFSGILSLPPHPQPKYHGFILKAEALKCKMY